MRIKLFRAATVALAMAEIRDTLGLDALILDTTKIENGVEITAALDAEEDDVETFFPLPGVLAFGGGEAPVVDTAPVQPNRPWSRHNLPAELETVLARASVDEACARLFRFAPLPLAHAAAPLMLVGPPGSGKTLTIAKLATRLVLNGQTPLVITAADQRAGAVEQLAGFTRLLGLTLIAAGRPETLARALARRAGGVPVLIDAPGFDLDEPAHASLLADLRDAAGANPILTLAAGIDPVEAADTAQVFATYGARHLLATRLDRRGRLGGILAAARAGDLALTEAGVGSAVANGLEPLSAEMLAQRLASDRMSPEAHAPARPAEGRILLQSPPVANVLAAHIAAQAGTCRTALWKTPS